MKGTATAVASSASSSSSPAIVPTVSKKPTNTTASASSSSSGGTVEQKVDAAIGMVMKYRAAGDGGQALRLLLTFVKNLVDFPTDIK